MDTTFITFQTSKQLAHQLRIKAAKMDISRSEALRQAAEMWLGATTCPACGKTTFQKDGVHWCEHCNMAVTVAQCPISLT